MLRLRRETDVAAIAEASHDPETRRRLNDEPLTPERQGESVSRAEEQWRSGTGAPLVIAEAGFQREGTLRAHCKTHGQRHDCVMFSLLPEDVEAR